MRSREVTSIKSFGGVDLSSPALQVDSSRAIKISNFIKKDGINQKRKGWEQVGEAPKISYYKVVNGSLTQIENPVNFNCIKEFYAEDGKKHIIAHIGYCLFECSDISDYRECTFTPLYEELTFNKYKYNTVIELNNARTEMFTGGNRLYILGGNKYYCLRFTESGHELFAVEDSKYTYTPVTMNQITYTDSPVTSRTALDDVNLLNSKRINKLVSGTLLNYTGDIVRTTKYYEYQLDTNINFSDTQSTDDIDITVEYVPEGD